MILKGIDGSEFELKIIGYQFPEIEDADWDSNWLMVKLRAKTLTEEWSITDPCLDTYEAVDLCDWLRMIAESKQVEMSLVFLEPELAFQIKETSGDFLVIEVKSHNWVEKSQTRISFTYTIDRKQLYQSAEEWCSEIQQFPTRVERKGRKRWGTIADSSS